ncbi:MAG: O-antigen ligase family protein [Patescibacteria group bacterium]|nr:O-antigen ligase family protein [Patescibacteria group bacterium]
MNILKVLKERNFWLVLILSFFLILGVAYAGDNAWFILAGILLCLLLLLFWLYPQAGIYLVVVLFPFNYWEFIYGSINVPYVDLAALILFVAWFFKAIYLAASGRKKILLKDFPALFFMLLFTAAAVLSTFDAPRELFWQSVKYVFRPIIFFYLMYVILPFNIIDNFKKLHNVFKIMFGLGLFLSAMGIWSLIFPPFIGLRRAVPIGFFGIWPLGTNHNSLAEVLIALIPAALILYWYEKDVFLRNFYFLGALLMIGVNLLTLSRSGWLAVLLELFIILAFKFKETTRRFFTSYVFYLMLVLVAPIVYLMYQLATSNIIVTSNLSRFKLIEIALYMFKQYPLFGYGAGTFVDFVNQTVWYIVEYGNPLDAHGFIFKTLAETGIFGTVSFLALLTLILYKLYAAYNKYKNSQYAWLLLGMLAMIFGCVVFQLFSTNYYLARLWLPIGLGLAAVKLCGLKLNKTLWEKK